MEAHKLQPRVFLRVEGVVVWEEGRGAWVDGRTCSSMSAMWRCGALCGSSAHWRVWSECAEMKCDAGKNAKARRRRSCLRRGVPCEPSLPTWSAGLWVRNVCATVLASSVNSSAWRHRLFYRNCTALPLKS